MCAGPQRHKVKDMQKDDCFSSHLMSSSPMITVIVCVFGVTMWTRFNSYVVVTMWTRAMIWIRWSLQCRELKDVQREDTFFVPLFMSFSSSITVVTVVRIDVIKKMTYRSGAKTLRYAKYFCWIQYCGMMLPCFEVKFTAELPSLSKFPMKVVFSAKRLLVDGRAWQAKWMDEVL